MITQEFRRARRRNDGQNPEIQGSSVTMQAQNDAPSDMQCEDKLLLRRYQGIIMRCFGIIAESSTRVYGFSKNLPRKYETNPDL
uniref:Uncharacterized protein n=1 Tax=Lactuca sativa TaxID=4236 RepID=A0A9R1UR56_LACSA|nr:hypothetical protein LSAT_V11C800400760 [Lactuca sativa]